MSQDTTPAPSAAASPQKKALLEAFDTVIKTAVEERELERLAAEARRRNRGASRLLLVVCATILVFVSVYLYVERPEWAFPTPSQPESTAVREASLRISLANAAQHVEPPRFEIRRFRAMPPDLPAARAHVEHAGVVVHEPEARGRGVRSHHHALIDLVLAERLTRRDVRRGGRRHGERPIGLGARGGVELEEFQLGAQDSAEDLITVHENRAAP
jgi:hypothetical protein